MKHRYFNLLHIFNTYTYLIGYFWILYQYVSMKYSKIWSIENSICFKYPILILFRILYKYVDDVSKLFKNSIQLHETYHAYNIETLSLGEQKMKIILFINDFKKWMRFYNFFFIFLVTSKKYISNLDLKNCNYIFIMFYGFLYIFKYIFYMYHILYIFKIIVPPYQIRIVSDTHIMSVYHRRNRSIITV